MIKKCIKLISLTIEIIYRDNNLWEYNDWRKTREMKKEAKEIFNSFLLVKIFKSI